MEKHKEEITMYDERCKICGAKESDHEIRYNFEINLDHNLSEEEAAKKLAERFAGEGIPCLAFESEVDHLPGCAVVIDYPHLNGRTVEVYCQDLSGKCSQLLAIHQGLAEIPK